MKTPLVKQERRTCPFSGRIEPRAGKPALRFVPAPKPARQRAAACFIGIFALIFAAPLPAASPAKTAPAPLQTASSRDFFSIQSVKFLKTPPRDKIGAWKLSDPSNPKSKYLFLPCLEIRCTALENTRSETLIAKAYFYDPSGKLIVRQYPSPSGIPASRRLYEMPVIFYKDKPDRIFFAIPESVSGTDWKAVVVFGDRQEAVAACYPPSESHFLLDYPEKKLVDARKTRDIARKPAMDPLIEHVVKTRNPAMPQITLFLRPPKGVSNPDEVRGVLAICILSSGVEKMRRELQKEEMPGDYAGLLSFANKEKLAILAWGSRGLWNAQMNHDDLVKEEAKEIDKSFDLVAAAWEQGVKELCLNYGIPDRNFLLWGSCGSAQWAHRLCLRKPEYFLAIAIHIPGSFDRPTDAARKVLWCLTTGELYGGYERSKRFVNECQQLGYPIVFKAIPGLGHAGHPDASALTFEFLRFALTQKDGRIRLDEQSANALASRTIREESGGPWPDAFRDAPFYGDCVNQEMFPAAQKEMIPEGFRIPLPTARIAKIWENGK